MPSVSIVAGAPLTALSEANFIVFISSPRRCLHCTIHFGFHLISDADICTHAAHFPGSSGWSLLQEWAMGAAGLWLILGGLPASVTMGSDSLGSTIHKYYFNYALLERPFFVVFIPAIYSPYRHASCAGMTAIMPFLTGGPVTCDGWWRSVSNGCGKDGCS